jgi:hypothetical protein
MKVLALFIHPNVVENENAVKYPYPTGTQGNKWNPHYRYPNGAY